MAATPTAAAARTQPHRPRPSESSDSSDSDDGDDADLRAECEQQRRKLEADAAQMAAERKDVALQRQERANLKQRPSLQLRSPPPLLMLTTMLMPTLPRR